jgi:hypothetical protein
MTRPLPERFDMVQIKGERGWFRTRGMFPDQGVITVWGPVDDAGSQHAMWRSFTVDRIKKVRRPKSV